MYKPALELAFSLLQFCHPLSSFELPDILLSSPVSTQLESCHNTIMVIRCPS